VESLGLEQVQSPRNGAILPTPVFFIARTLERELQVLRIYFHPPIHSRSQEFSVADLRGPLDQFFDVAARGERFLEGISEALPGPTSISGGVDFQLKFPV
jgi:hypothetical protein